MSSSLRQAWIVCYDICEPRRLAQVHAFLKRRAIPTQYSVFVAFMNQRQMQFLLAALEIRTHPDQDDVRVYPVPSYAEVFLLGGHHIPPGVTLPDLQIVKLLR